MCPHQHRAVRPRPLIRQPIPHCRASGLCLSFLTLHNISQPLSQPYLHGPAQGRVRRQGFRALGHLVLPAPPLPIRYATDTSVRASGKVLASLMHCALSQVLHYFYIYFLLIRGEGRLLLCRDFLMPRHSSDTCLGSFAGRRTSGCRFSHG